MLGQIEILLAFSTIMAAVSLIITVCNQILSAVLNLRGWSLRWGMAAALKSLFPPLKESPQSGGQSFADHIALETLTQPLISDSVLPVGHLTRHWRMASAIRLEEWQRILSVMTRSDKGKSPEAAVWTHEDALAWLSRRLDPVSDWFDAMMDRVKQHFTFYMRLSTVAFAAVFVFVFSFDAVSLYNALGKDVRLRNGVLANMQEIQNAKTVLDGLAESDEKLKQNADGIRQQLATASVEAIRAAGTLDSPWEAAAKDHTLWGELVTVALLSLGAPFWFNQLKNLSSLKSIVATREEKERTATPASSGPATPASRAIASRSERREGEVG